MATAEKTIVTQDPDIVTYLVKVGGKAIAKKYEIISITVEVGINKIPKASLIINDGEASTEKFEVSDSGEFSPGKEIEVQLGYQKDTKAENKTVFKGMIIKNSHKISNNYSELSIDCKHEAEKMTFNPGNRHFKKDMTDTDIVKEILEPYNFDTGDIYKSPTKQPQLMQSGKTDWDFIISRLDASKMICLFPDSKINIIKTPEKSTSPDESIFTLTYGKNILEFNGDTDSRVPSSKVKTVAWDFKTQEVIVVENESQDSEAEENKTDGQSEASKPAAVNDAPQMITTGASMPKESLQLIADSKALRQKHSIKKAKVKFLGNTVVKPADFIKLKGVGEKFNGNVFVSNIVHEYSDGCWITEATVGWDEKFFAEQTDPTRAASASGQASSLQGLHIGIVTKIEDGDGDYQVQVKLPLVNNKEDGIYARVATLDAGKKRGTFFRPEIDDEVVLGFMSDDPSSPVILGMLHSSAKPSPLEPEKNNDKKGYVSRSEIKLIFDDKEKSVIIETPGKRIFEMNDNAKTISVKDDFGNKILMEKSGITISSNKGDLTLKAEKGTVSLSGAKLALKAKGSITMEGGTASLKSSGLMEIKGSAVKIN